MPTPIAFITNYNFGEVVLIAFPFTDSTGSKKRPALVLYGAGDPVVLVARITSQSVLTEDDVLLNNWKFAGLLAPPTVRLHKVATLEKSLVSRSLGILADNDRQAITDHLLLAAQTLL